MRLQKDFRQKVLSILVGMARSIPYCRRQARVESCLQDLLRSCLSKSILTTRSGEIFCKLLAKDRLSTFLQADMNFPRSSRTCSMTTLNFFFKGFDLAAPPSTYPLWAYLEVDVMLQNRFQLLMKAAVLFHIRCAPFTNQGNRAKKTNRVFRLWSYLRKRLLYRCFWQAVNTLQILDWTAWLWSHENRKCLREPRGSIVVSIFNFCPESEAQRGSVTF